jgi:hypothetical protein
MSDLVKKVAVRYRQKGKARKQRVRQYRKNKSKSKIQNKLWRKKNPIRLRLYQKRRQRNPHQHELRRKSAMMVDPAALLPVHFWDDSDEVEGQVRSVGIDGTFIDAFMGEDAEEVRTYSLEEFLENCVVVDEGAERTFFDVLDEIHGIDAEQAEESLLVDLEEDD